MKIQYLLIVTLCYVRAIMAQINVLQQANKGAKQRQRERRNYGRQQKPGFIEQKQLQQISQLKEDKEQILREVQQVDFNGFAVSSFSYPYNRFIPIFSLDQKDFGIAGRFGQGKLFLFGHPGLYDKNIIGKSSNNQLLQNILKWINADKQKIILGLLHRQGGWPNQLSFTKISPNIQIKYINNGEDLKNVDIVCAKYYSAFPKTMTPEFNEQVRLYVQNGGNFLFFSHGWVWQTYNSNKQLIYENDFASYVLLRQFDITLRKDAMSFNKLIITKNEKIQNFLRNQLLIRLQDESFSSFSISENELKSILNTIKQTHSSNFQSICPQQLYHELVDAFIQSRFNIDNNYNKLQPSDQFICDVFNLMNAVSYAVPPHICRALPPSLNTYPGYATNKLQQKQIQVRRDQNQRVWTGLYINPGEAVKITHGNSYKDLQGVSLKVNLNFDLTRRRNRKLRRFTHISKQYQIKQDYFIIANPHGGIIFFQVSKNTQSQPLLFTFHGAYEAPYWNQNIHSYEDFNQIKKVDAPIFVIETRRINLIGPTKNILSQLDIDIERLCEYWNTVIGHYKDYRGNEQFPFKKQTIFNDVNIIGGYMHAGNPIMTFDDVTFDMLGVEGRIYKQGSWGFYHQLGHNHQDKKWTIGQMTQVTCNIYSLYLMHIMHGKTIQEIMYQTRKVRQPVNNYFALRQRNLQTYSKNPFVALVLFSNIMEQFGYEVFSNIHKRYDGITLQSNTVEQKVDRLVQQVSIVTGHNMHYYFRRWGLPVTNASLRNISQLPEYKCKRFPVITDRIQNKKLLR